jgi:hypothetical protein
LTFPDPSVLKLGIDLVQWLVMIALSISVWLRKPGEDAKLAVNELAERFGELETDLRVVEKAIEHLPTRVEFGAIATEIATVKSDNRAQTELLRTVQQQLNRIDDYLRSNH